MNPIDVLQSTVAGQYGAGTFNGGQVLPYRSEVNVSPTSLRETYTAMTLFIESWRWEGVPFYLRTGKAIKQTSDRSRHSVQIGPAHAVSQDPGGSVNPQ